MSIQEVWLAIREGNLDARDFEQWVMDQRSDALSEYEYNSSLED